MITILPITIAASAAEPGFSVLARNADANAVRSVQEFCVATGLNKKKICAGDPDSVELLGELTGSGATQLISNSPRQLHRKNTILDGKTLLSRSVRKADLSICPQCWSEIADSGLFRPYNLAMKRDWLLRPIQTCSVHHTRLVPLPFNDYSTCYDHVFRSRLNHSWLKGLPELIASQSPTKFEAAVIEHLDQDTSLCCWLDKVQIDVLERWCLGLGFFMERGSGQPVDLDINTQRQLIDIGFDVTVNGVGSIHNAVSAALRKHSIRMGKTWLYGWAYQAANPLERRPFRALMKNICNDQGDYCLLSVAKVDQKSPFVEAEIRKIAQKTDRSVGWVRNVLRTDGMIPENGIPTQGNLRQHMQICLRHVAKVADGINAKASAARLNIGIKAFEGLVGDGIIEPIKTETSAKPRYEARVVDELFAKIEVNLEKIPHNDIDEFMSIPDACFAVSSTTAKITSLLLSDQLPKSYTIDLAAGFSGIRVNISELRSKLLMHASTGLTMQDLRARLGLQYSEVKQLTTLKLLPSFSGRKEGSSRPALIVDPTDLAKFLERFQTIRTAAKQLGIDEGIARSRILNSKIYRAPEGQGLPIYKTSDIVGIRPRSIPRRRPRTQRAILQSGASPPFQP
ncbi:TniQ family protein [uncultured Pelagimonas sp.]|uniref:TniQ family protein n=1 Tax=uncultured Pelagimonas sp. TaxID=1618102 RepID=UPI002612421F|nr:TniQ family protein [uncultured Pelagimonas sp.]